ncbi:ribosome assembly factor SBDS [Candidatus Bathyarchaeota archaeon]|nr:ribosome assembly factor SBDS [Candidatus Bathyarchaeota archaeon]
MGEKHTTARLKVAGDQFEILVHPDPALNFKEGNLIDISQILVVDTVFSDVSKGLRASEDKLKSVFQTLDTSKIAITILKKGELQLTIEQRRRLIDEKRKQIISIISRNCVDPRTGAPHPPLRIKQAMEQIRVIIDPFKDAEEQSKGVIEDLRPILPLKMEQVRTAIKIPPEYAAQSIGVVKDFGTIKKEEWQADGSWVVIVEMPAGVRASFLDKLGRITKGNVQSKIL